MVKEYNKKLPVKFTIYDDKSDQATAKKYYERLVTVDKVQSSAGALQQPPDLCGQHGGRKPSDSLYRHLRQFTQDLYPWIQVDCGRDRYRTSVHLPLLGNDPERRQRPKASLSWWRTPFIPWACLRAQEAGGRGGLKVLIERRRAGRNPGLYPDHHQAQGKEPGHRVCLVQHPLCHQLHEAGQGDEAQSQGIPLHSSQRRLQGSLGRQPPKMWSGSPTGWRG